MKRYVQREPRPGVRICIQPQWEAAEDSAKAAVSLPVEIRAAAASGGGGGHCAGLHGRSGTGGAPGGGRAAGHACRPHCGHSPSRHSLKEGYAHVGGPAGASSSRVSEYLGIARRRVTGPGGDSPAAHRRDGAAGETSSPARAVRRRRRAGLAPCFASGFEAVGDVPPSGW